MLPPCERQSINGAVGVEQGGRQRRITGGGDEVVKVGVSAAGGADFVKYALVVRAARRGNAIEQLVAALNDAREGLGPIRATGYEVDQNFIDASGGDFVKRASGTGAAGSGGAVQSAIDTLHQRDPKGNTRF